MPRPPALRFLFFATAALAAIVTLVFTRSPERFSYRAPAAHIAIETAAALTALLIGFIVVGRFLQGGRISDLLLGSALAMIGSSSLFFVAIPAAAGSREGAWSTWAPLAGRAIGVLGIAAASLVGDRRVRRPRPLMLRSAAVCLGVLILIGAGFALLEANLPVGIDRRISPADSGASGNSTVLAVEMIQSVLYAVAALGFLRRAERTADALSAWVALATALLAASDVNYFLFPSLYSDWVYTGDFLRVAGWLVLLAGAAETIRRYQLGLGEAAALEERRRLARELHDGLAQELAFIATQTRWLSRRMDDPKGADALADAAQRALDESRSAISALTRKMDDALDVALAQAAEEVAGRVGVRLKLALEEGIEVPLATREALIRIVREAVSNTARHGKASVVTVELDGADGIRLRVQDDGIGFDPAERGDAGFGLTSMRDRARALGGDMHVASAPGAGTAVEVVLP